MIEFASFATALGALKTITDIAKNVNSIELTQKIIELQSSVLEMQTNLMELAAENSGLKEQIAERDRITELQKAVVYDDGVLWRKQADGKVEADPYCPACWEDKRKLVHLNPGASRGTYSCPIDKNSYRTRTFRNKYSPVS